MLISKSLQFFTRKFFLVTFMVCGLTFWNTSLSCTHNGNTPIQKKSYIFSEINQTFDQCCSMNFSYFFRVAKYRCIWYSHASLPVNLVIMHQLKGEFHDSRQYLINQCSKKQNKNISIFLMLFSKLCTLCTLQMLHVCCKYESDPIIFHTIGTSAKIVSPWPILYNFLFLMTLLCYQIKKQNTQNLKFSRPYAIYVVTQVVTTPFSARIKWTSKSIVISAWWKHGGQFYN